MTNEVESFEEDRASAGNDRRGNGAYLTPVTAKAAASRENAERIVANATRGAAADENDPTHRRISLDDLNTLIIR